MLQYSCMTNVIKELCGKDGKYTVEQIADVLGITARQVYRIRRKGKLPYTDLTGKTEYWKKINQFDRKFTKKMLTGVNNE